MTEQREPGSLWLVRRGAAWEVARWQQEEGISWWEIIGSEEGREPDYWDEIGSRVYWPGEASEDVERVAEALWEDWRTCSLASETFRDLSWARLNALAASSTVNVAQQYIQTAR